VRKTGRPTYNRRMYPSDDGQDVIGNGDQRDRPGGRLPWRPGWVGRNASVIVGLALAVGQTVWLTITFHVLVRCPQPYPVQFVVSYTDSGKLATTQMDLFPDLGQVAYSGCPATQ
jgi:hypothetical protein